MSIPGGGDATAVVADADIEKQLGDLVHSAQPSGKGLLSRIAKNDRKNEQMTAKKRDEI